MPAPRPPIGGFVKGPLSLADVVTRLMDEPRAGMNPVNRKRGKGPAAVSRLRGDVLSGTYEVNSEQVAEAMLARVGLWPLSLGPDDQTPGRAPHRSRQR
jgi:hypothetical protein